MKEHWMKLSLKNMSASEITKAEFETPFTGHLAQPESPALLFSDGTSVRLLKDSEGNLMLRVTEPE